MDGGELQAKGTAAPPHYGSHRQLPRAPGVLSFSARLSPLGGAALGKAKKYAAALGVKTKNDKVDAKALSRMGAEQALAQWQPMGTYFYELRSLTRHHESLSEMRTQVLNQPQAAGQAMHPSQEIIKSLEKMVEVVEEEMQKTIKAISLHMQSDEAVAKKVKHITVIKGVGERSVAVVLAETGGFVLFENTPQVVSYAG